mgnify:CR=1 FL=1
MLKIYCSRDPKTKAHYERKRGCWSSSDTLIITPTTSDSEFTHLIGHFIYDHPKTTHPSERALINELQAWEWVRVNLPTLYDREYALRCLQFYQLVAYFNRKEKEAF